MFVLHVLGCVVEAILLLILGLVYLTKYLFLQLFPKNPERHLRGEVVLVTGAGGYLGRALALELAARGCIVACVDVRKDDNDLTVEMVRNATKNQNAARSYVVDLSQREAIQDLVRRVLADMKHIDILLNNAVIMQGGKVTDFNDEQVQRIINVNLMSTIWLTRAVAPTMEKRGGQIVTISSLCAFLGMDCAPYYATAKAGLIGFMDSARVEFERRGVPISCTVVAPIFIRTCQEFMDSISAKLGKPSLETEDAAARIVHAVARRDYQVYLPGYVALLAAWRLLTSDRLENIFRRLMEVKVNEGVSREGTLPEISSIDLSETKKTSVAKNS